MNELKPYREERTQQRNQRKQLDSEDKAIFAGVQYKSEAELDQAIRRLEDRQAHDGGRPLREELNLVKEISRLNVRCSAIKQLPCLLPLTQRVHDAFAMPLSACHCAWLPADY